LKGFEISNTASRPALKQGTMQELLTGRNDHEQHRCHKREFFLKFTRGRRCAWRSFQSQKYPDFFLPTFVLQRTDAVLESAKQAVLDTKKILDDGLRCDE